MKYKWTIAVTTLILMAVLLPGSNVPAVNIVGIDKLVHFTLFFLWSLAVRSDFNRKFKWFWGWSAGLGFAISTEVLQLFTEDRSFDGWDILFDAVGLAIGLMAGPFMLRLVTVWRKKNA
jgi:VanZ family protein